MILMDHSLDSSRLTPGQHAMTIADSVPVVVGQLGVLNTKA